MPKDVGENIQRLKMWQKKFDGDSFVYDYHLIWDQNNDLGGYKSANILFEDMKNLDKLGINGMISCQVQRAFYPTGLSMYGMAAALWDKTTEFETVATNYFNDLFSVHGKKMQDYFKTLSDLLDPPYLRKEKDVVSEDSVKQFSKVRGVVDEMAAFISDALGKESDPCRKKTWQSLVIHGKLCNLMADVLIERANGGDIDAIKAKWEIAKDYITRSEAEVHDLFDVWYFIKVMCRFLGIKENQYA